MAIGGCEVSYRFLDKTKKCPILGTFFMNEEQLQNEVLTPDWTDIDEVRKAIIASEILNRKY